MDPEESIRPELGLSDKAQVPAPILELAAQDTVDPMSIAQRQLHSSVDESVGEEAASGARGEIDRK